RPSHRARSSGNEPNYVAQASRLWGWRASRPQFLRSFDSPGETPGGPTGRMPVLRDAMIHILDTLHLDRPGIIAVTALETSDGIALFDTGADSTFQNIASELRAAGFSPNDVRHVFLSHIHLDHAGAAWCFAEQGATIHVHPRGARHLVDPSKLMESATRIFG